MTAVLAVACERPSDSVAQGPRTLELERDTIQLGPDVSLHDVTVRSTRDNDFSPREVRARVGDVVRFTSADSRTHGIVLTPPTPEAAALLEAAAQLRSPPLIAAGQAFVVSLARLPVGRYTVSCISHAGTAIIVVQ